MPAGKAIAILVLLFSCPHAVALVDEASLSNTALAPSLLGAQNACNFSEEATTEGNMLSVAEIKAIAMVPQVDGITSDLASPKLLWSWSASFPKSASFPLPPHGSCPAGEIEYYNPSAAYLKGGKLTYLYGNAAKEIALAPDGPNPVAMELEGNGSGTGVFANLSVALEAKIGVRYTYRKIEYRETCQQMGGYLVCGCEEKSEFGMRTFENGVADSRDFPVETGPVEEAWLNPPLEKRLEGNGTGRLLLFARRMPSNISIFVDGVEISHVEPYAFYAVRGGCGEALVQKKFAPQGMNAFLNRSDDAVNPFQLVNDNQSYLPFYLEFGWGEAPGKKMLDAVFEDCFSNRENKTREFSVREPAPFSPDVKAGEGDAMDLRGGSDSKTPAAYPAGGDTGMWPDFSALALLFAIPFALWAGALIKKSS